MKAHAVRRDLFFYPLAFTLWSAFILIRFSHYSYFASPLPPVKAHMQVSEELYKSKMIEKSIEELQASLKEEESAGERGHIEHNIGTAYYDRYKATKKGENLDSAQAYYERSIKSLPTVARFYYNLGRIFTERREHARAKTYYEKCLELNPDHVLALHNLALLCFYELGDKPTAKRLLENALAIRPELPICNYVLGEIALQQKEYAKARDHFRAEINGTSLYAGGKRVPVSQSATSFALAKSHLELAILYSTKFVDSKLAQANLHGYLRMEADPQRREAAIAQMKKYWVVKAP